MHFPIGIERAKEKGVEIEFTSVKSEDIAAQAGRVSRLVEPKIDRSVSPDEIRRDPAYLDTVEEIWSVLRDYVE